MGRGGLMQLYANGIQTDPHINNYKNNCKIINNNENKIICNCCVKENKVPKEFYYYGNAGLLTNYSLSGNDIKKIKYNMVCSNGHYFIYGWYLYFISIFCY